MDITKKIYLKSILEQHCPYTGWDYNGWYFDIEVQPCRFFSSLLDWEKIWVGNSARNYKRDGEWYWAKEPIYLLCDPEHGYNGWVGMRCYMVEGNTTLKISIRWRQRMLPDVQVKSR